MFKGFQLTRKGFLNVNLSSFLATSAKNTERSHDIRILSRDLLKKRNLLLTLLVS